MTNGLRLFPEAASTIARSVDALYIALSVGTAIIVFLIFLVVVIFAVRFRHRAGNRFAERVEQSVLVEVTWSVVPLFVLLGVFGWSAKIYFDQSVPPANSDEIYVVGKQWMWKLQHPQGKREINELHVPANTPIKLVMTSQDVIHSFFIPAFRVKQDVLPGRYTTLWFEATKTGRFPIVCAEFCGTDHSKMRGWVYAMEPEAYQQWLSGAATGMTMSEAGEKVFHRLGCVSCHAKDAPPLQGLYGSRVPLSSGAYVIADDNYLRQSIINPLTLIVRGYEPLMPTFSGLATEEEILQLIAYIRSLRDVPRRQSPDAESAGASTQPQSQNTGGTNP